ncbi:MAG: hypothetical protein R2784_14830 [Saprospiraceae bacterium]
MENPLFVTDRTDLEEQLSGTSDTIGYSVKAADRIRKLKTYLPGFSRFNYGDGS